MNFKILKKDYAFIPSCPSDIKSVLEFKDISLVDLSSTEVTPSQSVKNKKGRPKKYSLTKKEYNKLYNKQRYEEKKEVLKRNSTLISKKYRDSYKILQIIYQKSLVDENNELFKRLEEILEL